MSKTALNRWLSTPKEAKRGHEFSFDPADLQCRFQHERVAGKFLFLLFGRIKDRTLARESIEADFLAQGFEPIHDCIEEILNAQHYSWLDIISTRYQLHTFIQDESGTRLRINCEVGVNFKT